MVIVVAELRQTAHAIAFDDDRIAAAEQKIQHLRIRTGDELEQRYTVGERAAKTRCVRVRQRNVGEDAAVSHGSQFRVVDAHECVKTLAADLSRARAGNDASVKYDDDARGACARRIGEACV